jgi:YidC/Oxa1 family membrane protein insertase
VLWEPTWYNLSDQAVVAVKAFHDLTGVEYGWAIVGVTVLLRLALFPLMVTSQRTTSRMAHVQPELTLIKSRYEALGTPSRQDQLAFSKQMKALFDKYQVHPLKAILAPVVQLPLFMGMFFGLRKMPTIYHDELATGGMFWFVDLTVPDPLYILPLASSATFLLLIELGKDQMMAQNAATGKLMINVFRVMSVAMVPVCVSFESAMLCYWTANNLLTLAQTQVLKAPLVKQQFGIWDPPKPIPGLQPESLTEAAAKLIKRIQGKALTEKQEMERHNQQVEVKKKGRSFQATMRSRLQQRGSGTGSGRSSGVTGKRSKTTTTTTTQR